VQQGRAWLDVPFAEKDEAKAAGARWDPAARRWYAPPGHGHGLARSAGLPEVPDVLPGEDRGFGTGLFVDLVPASCWFTNVRSCVSPRDWERLRRPIVGRAGRVCEACGQGPGTDVHERWAYDDAAGVQHLRRLIWVCKACHEATHMGLANLRGRGPAARAHLQQVTGMTAAQAAEHVERAFAVWARRSTRAWELDLTMLTAAGVRLVRPPQADDRVQVAEETLQHRHGSCSS
jgi:hypothetical protein